MTDSIVEDNVGMHQDVGINLYRSRGNTIQHNDFSNNTAWGIRLYASGSNMIRENTAQYVNRCAGEGCDSAGILLTHGSHDNAVLDNQLQYSGNGFFIGNQRAYPSNNNLIERNDGSFAPNNAFEVTFSEGNTIRFN